MPTDRPRRLRVLHNYYFSAAAWADNQQSISVLDLHRKIFDQRPLVAWNLHSDLFERQMGAFFRIDELGPPLLRSRNF